MIDLQLLPADPVGFFGLSDGYDRRDLKRAYGKAIRQYKPESHPAEFRLIRDAYERLEKLLRYGKQQQKDADAASAWASEESREDFLPEDHSATSQTQSQETLVRASVEQSTKPATKRAPELTLRQLAVADPPAALKRLQAAPRRSPQDYYLAAVLADATAGRPTSQYLGQLIDGLVAHPADPGLTVLATEFLRVEVPDAMAGKIVRFVATKVRSPLFYMLTEPLWIRLVEALPFEQVERLLKACEQEIQQTEPATRTTFYLRFLRSSIWTAPAEWTGRVLSEIESQSAGLDASSQADLEFLTEIQDLLRSQPSGSPSDPVRKKLLHAIRLACRADEGAATAEIIQSLHEIAKDATGVQTAFPLDDLSDDESWVTLTYTLVHQMYSYLGEPQKISDERLATQTVHMLADLEPKEAAVTSSYQRAQWRYKTLPLIAWLVFGTVFLALPVVTIVAMSFQSASGLMSLVGIAVVFVSLVVGFYRWLYPKYLRDREEAMHRQWAMQDYKTYWRSRLFRYAQSSSEPMETQLAFIQAVCRRVNQPNLGQTIQQFVRRDPGLCIYAGLQALLR